MSEIPKMTEAIVRNLARLYASADQQDIVELLARSTPEMVETSYDGWDGGMYGFTLFLHAPIEMYARVENRKQRIERELYNRVIDFLRRYQFEKLDDVVISPKLEPAGATWRADALKWLQMNTNATPASEKIDSDFDFFICHATEDKDRLVRPLANELRAKGARVWYDEFTLTIGDGLRRSIDRGLSRSRFGIVVLSLAFFAKNWPQYELDGLTARQIVGKKVILPIWHGVSRGDIIKVSPSLADMLAFDSTKMQPSDMVDKLMELLSIQPGS